MALTPPPRLNNPDEAGSFVPDTPDPESGTAASPVPAEANPGAMEDTQNILQITSAARKIALKYPTAVPEVQAINNAVQQLQMKITAVQPPTEVAAPPQ